MSEKTRVCTECKKKQDIEEFTYGNKVIRVVWKCKKCRNNDCKKYKKGHREDVSKYNKKYKSDNKDDIDEYNKKYFAANKDTIYTHKKNNPQYAITSKLRADLNRLIKRESKKYELIGCSRNFLTEWFKFLFEEDMNFDNYGTKWQVDHVIPCINFDLLDNDDVNKCFHW
jgi:hypothetical protein